jgi:hypothetical protein
VLATSLYDPTRLAAAADWSVCASAVTGVNSARILEHYFLPRVNGVT